MNAPQTKNKTMKSSIKFRVVLPIMTLILVFSCCKDEDCSDPSNPECENYDPCYRISLPSAKFLMEEQIWDDSNERVYIADDSIFVGSDIRFRSTFESDEYKHTWYVGTEVLNGPSVIRNFLTVTNRPSHITISHVMEYPVDSNCFPFDDGRDSVSQTFYLIEYWRELNVRGSFRGLLSGQTDSFDFKARRLYMDGTDAKLISIGNKESSTYFINFHNEGDSITHDFFSANNVGYFTGSGGPSPDGVMTYNPYNNSISLKYTFRNQDFELTGRKLN